MAISAFEAMLINNIVEAMTKALEMCIRDRGMDYAKIAEELDTGNSTPRRWITAIINELSVLLWGMDEDKIR